MYRLFLLTQCLNPLKNTNTLQTKTKTYDRITSSLMMPGNHRALSHAAKYNTESKSETRQASSLNSLLEVFDIPELYS